MSVKHVWDSESFRQTVLGNSLAAGAPRGPTAPPAHVPTDAFALVTRQLKLASLWPALPACLKKAFTRAYQCFERSADLLDRAAKAQTGDPPFVHDFHGTVVSRVRSLGPGEALVLSRPSPLPGEKDDNARIHYVVHRNAVAPAGCDYSLAVCTMSTAALEYHPAKVDPATGSLSHATPLLLRDIPSVRLCDGAFWYLALLVEHKDLAHASALYERLLPALNGRPLLSNWSNEALADPNPAGLRAPATSHWRPDALAGPNRPADLHGHELASLAGVAAVQLAVEGDISVASGLAGPGRELARSSPAQLHAPGAHDAQDNAHQPAARLPGL